MDKNKRTVINSIEELEKVACILANIMKPDDTVALYGNLGAGKTTLIKKILKCMGFDENDISSPSFTIMNIYENRKGEKAIHFDFYRIKTKEEFFYMDYDEYTDNYLTFIEWPEKIDDYMPDNTLKIYLYIEGEKRYIEVERNGKYLELTS